MKTIFKMKRDARIGKLYPIYLTGSFPISMLRNRAVSDALSMGCDYILMIDNDMAPDLPDDEDGGKPFWETAWEFMMHRREMEAYADYPPCAVAAPYLCDSDGGFYSTDWKTTDPKCRSIDDLVQISKEDALSRRGILPVATTQTGLILYDMRSFGEITPPWFTFYWQDPAQLYMQASEDHYQTWKSNASGFPVYMAWDCWAGHLKTKYVIRNVPEDVDIGF